MPRRLAFLCILLLFSSTSAFAQNFNDLFNRFGGFRFGGFLQRGMVQAAPQSIPPPISSSRPTFDCAKARTPVAQILCSSGDGALADWDLNASAWAYTASLDDEARKAFGNEQDEWLGSLNTSCKLTLALSPTQSHCVVDAYERRAKSLQSKMSLDAQAEVTLTPEQRSVIQGQLVLLGFLNGEADGEFGPSTREAIKKFQQSNRHAAANYLTEEERRTLLSQSSQIPTNGPQRSPTIAPSLPSPADNSAKKIAEAEAAKRAAEEDPQRKTAEAEAAKRAADEAVTRRTAEAGAAKRAAEEVQRRTAEAERAKRAAASRAAADIKLACDDPAKGVAILFVDTDAKQIVMQSGGLNFYFNDNVEIGPDTITGTGTGGDLGPLTKGWVIQIDRRTGLFYAWRFLFLFSFAVTTTILDERTEFFTPAPKIVLQHNSR